MRGNADGQRGKHIKDISGTDKEGLIGGRSGYEIFAGDTPESGTAVGVHLSGKGNFSAEQGGSCKGPQEYFLVSREALQETVSYVSRYSIYAFDEEMRQGYITLPGGHRVGLAGKIVMEDGRIRCVKYISFL